MVLSIVRRNKNSKRENYIAIKYTKAAISFCAAPRNNAPGRASY